VTPESRRAILRQRRTKLPKNYTANQIAEYFLAKTNEEVGDQISNLKLQKLCYYAQGLALAARRQAFFESRIEAWAHGPVVPVLYQLYRDHGANGIPAPGDFKLESYDAADRMILDDVYDYYGQYSAWRLREMTHLEAPWKDAYERGMNHVISHDALTAFFADQISSDYSQKYEQVSRR
jgi:uncharacterized phage-associated protein